jgi:ubiquinone/menaquinone biosynthesis C-methylase UbiE
MARRQGKLVGEEVTEKERESMDAKKKEQSGTYFVQDRQSEIELRRLTVQDHMVTQSMGGILPEQAEPAKFRHVLDIACGPGGWLLEAAQTYPTMELTGIDISQRMIEYARHQAASLQVADRVRFRVMDALLILELPDAYFDLVNLRFSGSFMRTWDWPKMISEMLRVARPGATIRLTDAQVSVESSSTALARLYEILRCAFYKAGNLFEDENTGLINHFAPLLTQHGCKQVQTKVHALTYRSEDAEALTAYHEDMKHVFHTVRPYIAKWGCLPPDYDEIYQQMLTDMQQPGFHSFAKVLTSWGTK